jgi:hypothetical protein
VFSISSKSISAFSCSARISAIRAVISVTLFRFFNTAGRLVSLRFIFSVWVLSHRQNPDEPGSGKYAMLLLSGRGKGAVDLVYPRSVLIQLGGFYVDQVLHLPRRKGRQLAHFFEPAQGG